jgi:hypothetical protein
MTLSAARQRAGAVICVFVAVTSLSRLPFHETSASDLIQISPGKK